MLTAALHGSRNCVAFSALSGAPCARCTTVAHRPAFGEEPSCSSVPSSLPFVLDTERAVHMMITCYRGVYEKEPRIG